MRSPTSSDRRLLRHAARDPPGDVRAGDVATCRPAGRPAAAPRREAGGIESQAVSDHGPGARGVAAALLEAPQLLAGERIVAVRGLGPQAEQHRLPVDLVTCGVENALRKSPSACGLPSGPRSSKVDRPRRLPHGLAGVLVERDDVLVIAAVEVHDQQVAEQDRRRPGAADSGCTRSRAAARAPCRCAASRAAVPAIRT